ncbi:MAG TPA: hypothetical protein DCO80_15765 [Ornithinibacillus sp.]|nr:hypothetical protein [Ornithinibacillus sp.]
MLVDRKRIVTFRSVLEGKETIIGHFAFGYIKRVGYYEKEEAAAVTQRNTGRETTPHSDGKRESIINSSAGVQFGIKSNVQHDENSSSHQKTKDDQLMRFEKLMRGTPVNHKDKK